MASLYLITAPTAEVVTAAEFRAQLRGAGASLDDDVIEALIASAVNQIDPAGGGWLGRALRPQTWEIRASHFPCGFEGCGYYRNFRRTYVAELPYPPHMAVVSVKYDDGDGVETTLVENTGFRVIGLGGIGKSYVAPIYNGSWPSNVRADDESVRIRFTSGYAVSGSIDPLPAPIKQAVILMAKQLFDLYERNLLLSELTIEGVSTRRFVVSENASNLLKSVSENLLAPYRVFE